jgi:GNAT superfamily N-acetyltransferase
MSVLEYPPGVGNVWTDYTGTARSARGRGIARALKCETIMQAIALGVTHVRTNNDGENKPILHLNEELGYQRIPGNIQLLKPAPAG